MGKDLKTNLVGGHLVGTKNPTKLVGRDLVGTEVRRKLVGRVSEHPIILPSKFDLKFSGQDLVGKI